MEDSVGTNDGGEQHDKSPERDDSAGDGKEEESEEEHLIALISHAEC